MSEQIIGGGSLFHEAPLLTQAAMEDQQVADFLTQVEETFGVLPEESTVSRHVAAMLDQAAAPAADTPAVRKLGWSRRRRTAVVVAATLAFSSMLVSFSYAGFFTFPQPVRSALSWLGLDLPAPDQGNDASSPTTGGSVAPDPAHPAGPPKVPAPGNQVPGGNQAPVRGDQPGAPGGAPGDQPGGGDRPDRPASPCPFPQDILGCDEDGGIGP